jgi:hypothetical protein
VCVCVCACVCVHVCPYVSIPSVAQAPGELRSASRAVWKRGGDAHLQWGRAGEGVQEADDDACSGGGVRVIELVPARARACLLTCMAACRIVI